MDKPWKVIAAFAGVFAFGGVFGGLIALRFEHQQPPRRPQPRGQAPAQPGILMHLVDRLELTADQREKIRPTVERAEEDLRRIRATSFRESGVIFKRLNGDLEKDLTPEQRKRLERMQERQNEILNGGDRGGFPRGDRPGPGGGKRPTPGRPEPAGTDTSAPAPGK